MSAILPFCHWTCNLVFQVVVKNGATEPLSTALQQSSRMARRGWVVKNGATEPLHRPDFSRAHARMDTKGVGGQEALPTKTLMVSS